MRNHVISLQRRSERKYYREQLEINEHDLRKSWNILKHIIGKEERSQTRKLEFNINNRVTSDSHSIANHFNNYFVNVGKNLAEKIVTHIDPLTYITYNAHQLRIPRIEEPEILNVIAQLKNSAAGHDSLPGSIMKQCADKYIVPLTHIINLSITKGYFPEEFKLAKVLPIFKSGDDQNIQNYRPISMLPFFSKIFEKIMASHIMDFLDTNNILYDKQFGFRKSHSTSHAIITLVDKVFRALDTGKFIVRVFLDLKKAFDTVDHTILLKKLHAYGIRDNHLDWFKSYLHNRTQYVTYNNARSDIKTITHGVPQGSILGPLLFIIYVNDFSRASSLLFSILFADDTSVFIEGECYTGVINILNKELNSICLWLKSNKLTLNVKKITLHDVS